MTFRTGHRNLITDVKGIFVGNDDDEGLKSGVTALICERPTVAAVEVLGGAPGTRETDTLAPHSLAEAVDALVLSGGSAFGLDAASGVQAWLRDRGRGFAMGGHVVPIVPAAILFDLANGGDKGWGRYPPYREMGFRAADSANRDFAIGTAGAGAGALTAGLKGGLGSASVVLESGVTIGALAAVNAAGSVTIAQTPHFWAAPHEIGTEFGGLGLPSPLPADSQEVLLKHRAAALGSNTTIGIVATDARLERAAAKRLAIAAHDGFARAIWPVHTPVDGDLVFAVATGETGESLSIEQAIEMHAAATLTMARAIARAIHAATPRAKDVFPTWSMRLQAGIEAK